MSKARLEWRVGVFVVIGLVVLAGLLIKFSKGNAFEKTNNIILRATDVGELKKKANVLMSGVQIGIVSDIRLGPRGTNVSIYLNIYSQYTIYKDARFQIEQSGFLGDKYVSITPTKNEGDVFKDGDTAEAEPPFNMQEIARSANGLLGRVQDTALKLNEAIADIRNLLVNEHTLTNLAVAAENMRTVSEKAIATVEGFNSLVTSNRPALSDSMSNLVEFTKEMKDFSGSLSGLVQSNKPALDQAVKNIESSTVVLKTLLTDVEEGKGLAGNLLKNEKLSADVSEIASNLSLVSSNLNRLGLWGVLWKKKPPAKETPAREAVKSQKER